jgi:hypothetical protein
MEEGQDGGCQHCRRYLRRRHLKERRASSREGGVDLMGNQKVRRRAPDERDVQGEGGCGHLRWGMKLYWVVGCTEGGGSVLMRGWRG